MSAKGDGGGTVTLTSTSTETTSGFSQDGATVTVVAHLTKPRSQVTQVERDHRILPAEFDPALFHTHLTWRVVVRDWVQSVSSGGSGGGGGDCPGCPVPVGEPILTTTSSDSTTSSSETTTTSTSTSGTSTTQGTLKGFAVILEDRTDPVRWDTDGDGLSDGWEVANGLLPVARDTDGDGISDFLEVTGWSRNADGAIVANSGGFRTNPLLRDTDGDGVPDAEDLDPLRNLLVAVRVKQLHHGGAWWDPELVAVVRVNEGNEWVHTWVTEHRMGSADGSDDHTASFYMTYYADVPDDVAQVSVRVTGWSINCCRGDDLIVDASVTYTLNSGTSSYTWYDGDSWITFDVWTRALTKARALLVTDDVVTVTAENGEVRMAAPDRFVVLTLDVSGATSSHYPILNGVNTILVPRALFLDSKLKARFDAGNFWPISTAALYGEDLGASAVSAAVAGLVTATLGGGDAKFLLDRLPEDGSGSVVRRAVPMYDAALRANLPADVVKILPWSPVTMGPTGAVPQDFWRERSQFRSPPLAPLIGRKRMNPRPCRTIGASRKTSPTA